MPRGLVSLEPKLTISEVEERDLEASNRDEANRRANEEVRAGIRNSLARDDIRGVYESVKGRIAKLGSGWRGRDIEDPDE